ncbi:MAG: hypothetical protein V1738_00515 [Patescibacteria group bacterium]
MNGNVIWPLNRRQRFEMTDKMSHLKNPMLDELPPRDGGASTYMDLKTHRVGNSAVLYGEVLEWLPVDAQPECSMEETDTTFFFNNPRQRAAQDYAFGHLHRRRPMDAITPLRLTDEECCPPSTNWVEDELIAMIDDSRTKKNDCSDYVFDCAMRWLKCDRSSITTYDDGSRDGFIPSDYPPVGSEMKVVAYINGRPVFEKKKQQPEKKAAAHPQNRRQAVASDQSLTTPLNLVDDLITFQLPTSCPLTWEGVQCDVLPR